MHLGIVLLQLLVASPTGTLLKQSVTLWLGHYITKLLSTDSSIAMPSSGIRVFAGLLMGASHKHQLGGTPVADTHVHMYCNGMTDSGDCASGTWCAPPDYRSALDHVWKYLESVIKSRRHDTSSVLRHILAKVSLPLQCWSVTCGTTLADKGLWPFFFRILLTVLGLKRLP